MAGNLGPDIARVAAVARAASAAARTAASSLLSPAGTAFAEIVVGAFWECAASSAMGKVSRTRADRVPGQSVPSEQRARSECRKHPNQTTVMSGYGRCNAVTGNCRGSIGVSWYLRNVTSTSRREEPSAEIEDGATTATTATTAGAGSTATSIKVVVSKVLAEHYFVVECIQEVAWICSNSPPPAAAACTACRTRTVVPVYKHRTTRPRQRPREQAKTTHTHTHSTPPSQHPQKTRTLATLQQRGRGWWGKLDCKPVGSVGVCAYTMDGGGPQHVPSLVPPREGSDCAVHGRPPPCLLEHTPEKPERVQVVSQVRGSGGAHLQNQRHQHLRTRQHA